MLCDPSTLTVSIVICEDSAFGGQWAICKAIFGSAGVMPMDLQEVVFVNSHFN